MEGTPTAAPEGERADAAASAEADIHLEGVSKRFGDAWRSTTSRCRSRAASFYAMLGPSGCGKTTTLRMIGGFEDPTAGRVFLGGDDVTQPPALQARRQHGLPVLRAVPAPERREERRASASSARRSPRPRSRKRVGEALELVQLGHLAKRKPGQLSGGQQQRVALARALVNRPRALLLDEPLGALDLRLRKQLQIELKRIQQDIGITFVHVTHDQEEAMTHGRHDRGDERRQDRAGRLARPSSTSARARRSWPTSSAISNLIDAHGARRDDGHADGRDPRRRRAARPAPSAAGRTGPTRSASACGPEKITLVPGAARPCRTAPTSCAARSSSPRSSASRSST